MRSPDQMAGMLCPVDKTPLTMSDRNGIEIDYCPQCRGVWLDRGELDKIIERDPGSAAAPPPPQAPQAPQAPPPPQYAQPHYAPPPPHYGHSHGHYGYKRKKHWLEDIFD